MVNRIYTCDSKIIEISQISPYISSVEKFLHTLNTSVARKHTETKFRYLFPRTNIVEIQQGFLKIVLFNLIQHVFPVTNIPRNRHNHPNIKSA